MFSQGDEERAIIGYFNGRTGRLLDVGAWDGMIFSNSRMLVEMGWSAVLVEPNAHAFDCLMRYYRRFADRVDLVNAAVVPNGGGVAGFWQADGATSTTVEAHKDRWEREGMRFLRTWVGAVSAEHLLAALPGPYDFVNVDAEGVSVEIARALLGQLDDTKLWCVEADDAGAATAIQNAFGARGYRTVHRTSDNVLLGR